MYYAFLVLLSCSGFECEIEVIEQWQSTQFTEIILACNDAARQNKQATCIFDSEEI